MLYPVAAMAPSATTVGKGAAPPRTNLGGGLI
jgi:hypothetical protein